jgi:hypothetical protein
MVSDVSTGTDLEGWTLVDAIAPNDVCTRAKARVGYRAFDYKVLPPKYERKSVDTDQAKQMSFILCYV